MWIYHTYSDLSEGTRITASGHAGLPEDEQSGESPSSAYIDNAGLHPELAPGNIAAVIYTVTSSVIGNQVASYGIEG